jgi:hypothetical protein
VREEIIGRGLSPKVGGMDGHFLGWYLPLPFHKKLLYAGQHEDAIK